MSDTPCEKSTYMPEERADVDRKWNQKEQKRPRKHKDKAEVRMKNDDGIAEFDVTVVEADYDEVEAKWMYTLTDCDGKAIGYAVPENKLV